MSVYKSQRKESIASYLSSTRNLRKDTIRYVKKFPNSYRYSITNNMLELAANAYTDVLKADSIHLTKNTDPNDYDLRHRYLTLALSNVNALAGEITFCYFLVRGQNDIFKSRTAYNNAFKQWTQSADNALQKIQNAINNDSNFWNKIHSEEEIKEK